MVITSGRVVGQLIEYQGELPDGATVTIVAKDEEETFRVDDELKAVLLESIAQGDRGETIPAEEVFRELRARER